MELTQTQTNNSKGIAILMMLCLHLFNTLNYQGLFVPLIFIGDKPLVYYISLFCDCCVPIYCFCMLPLTIITIHHVCQTLTNKISYRAQHQHLQMLACTIYKYSLNKYKPSFMIFLLVINRIKDSNKKFTTINLIDRWLSHNPKHQNFPMFGVKQSNIISPNGMLALFKC